MGSEVKTCTACEREKPLDAFYFDAANNTYKSRCKECHQEADKAGKARRERERYESMIPWATPTEREVVEALIKAGDVVGAAAELGMTPVRMRAHLSELARRAAAKGWSPAHDMTKTVPDGYHVKGVSTYYRVRKDPTTGEEVSEARGQWVKSNKDAEHLLADLMHVVAAMVEPARGAADPVPAPTERLDRDLLAVYPMGDPHVGMFAWAVETGADDHNLQIAERDLVDAVDHLVDLAPAAEQALIINLGDFFHADNKGSTTTKGTRVDTDTRWPKVLQTGVKIMRRAIDRALEKHARVRVINVIGNHDDHAAIMLSITLAAVYEREPRVEIDTSPGKFHWFRFGANLIGAAHGDACKVGDLPSVMACDRAADWGETVHRAFYTGHVHHDTLKEFPGVVVETMRTLAPSDAWHAGQGYRSGRDMKLDVWHRTDGRILRHTVGIAQLRRKQAARP
jgi:hypothetical protein